MSGACISRRSFCAASTAVAGAALAGCAHPPAPPGMVADDLGDLFGSAPVTLPGTHRADLRDPASGHDWRIWVQRPRGPAPAGGHPVLYLLDGNASFVLAAQLARNQTLRPADVRGDAAVIVGIGHPVEAASSQPLRLRDYTPSLPGQAALPAQGGADVLRRFIAEQLRPRLARAMPLDPQRQTLWGHSFGGLFVLHTLYSAPALFTRYAAASPSIWWNGAQLEAEAQRFIATHAQAPRAFQAHVQLRVGELEQASAAPTPARAATLRERRMLERAQALGQRLQALAWPELTADFAIYPRQDHGGVMLPSLVDALALAQRPVAPA